jgi:hypothetical protein
MATLDELLALLPDNTTGEIAPVDLRTIVTELWAQATTNPYVNSVSQGPFTLPVAAAFTALPSPGPVTGTITLDTDTTMLVIISANVDSVANNNQMQLALELSGATILAAGTKPEQVLWAGGKQAVQSTLEVTYVQRLLAGTTNAEVRYTAQQAGGTVSALAVIAMVMAE